MAKKFMGKVFDISASAGGPICEGRVRHLELAMTATGQDPTVSKQC